MEGAVVLVASGVQAVLVRKAAMVEQARRVQQLTEPVAVEQARTVVMQQRMQVGQEHLTRSQVQQ